MSKEPPKAEVNDPARITEADLASDEAFAAFLGQQVANAADEDDAKRIKAYWQAYRTRGKAGD